MLFLRLACLAAGILVLIAPPAMLLPGGPVNPSPAWTAGVVAAVLLPAAAFLFIGMNVHRVRRSPALGRLCALALLAPLLAGLLTMWRSANPTTLWMSGLMLCFTLMLCALLAKKLLRTPSPNRIRYRTLPH
jgi:hypothetical protein